MTEDLTPQMRKLAEFPAEHMRIIGEICVYWSAVEQMTLQAVCEGVKIAEYEGQYLGQNIPAGIRFDMLHALANSLKEEAHLKAKGTELIRLLQPVRDAYLLRNKYAHAHLRTTGVGTDPQIHFARTTKRLHIENRPLPLKELKEDADAIFTAGQALITFLQQHGFCTKAWS